MKNTGNPANNDSKNVTISTGNVPSLFEEIKEKSKEIQADSYDMSIGELISMYKEGDLEIHPEFQRFFRWSEMQKTKLIESFLLNIPVPPIFVSQREDGVWDVVDGLQRLSTIFQFVGIYRDENKQTKEPLVLEATKLLPALEGKKYSDANDPANSFTETERRYLKRAKISINILKKESDASSKYELFQRLNTGGTSLSDQEVRNCLMVMTDPSKFEIIQDLSKDINFVSSLNISEKDKKERYDLELITRFICLRHEDVESIKNIKDLSSYLDDKIIEICGDKNFDWNTEEKVFHSTFKTINDGIGDDAFRKFDVEKSKFKGGFYISSFEIVAIGLGLNGGKIPVKFDLKKRVKNLWHRIEDKNIKWLGNSASGRLAKTLKLGKELYEQN